MLFGAATCLLLASACSNSGAPSGDDSIESAIMKGKQDAGITDTAVKGKDSAAPTKADPKAQPSGEGSSPPTTDDRDL